MNRHLAYLLLLIAACLYAAVRGGRPERIGAATFVAGSVLSLVLSELQGIGFRGPELGIITVDAAMFGIFTWLSLRSTRFWPIWVSGVIGSELIVHTMRAAAPAIVPQAYLDAQALWSWIALTILILGTRRHVVRRYRRGTDPDWRTRTGT